LTTGELVQAEFGLDEDARLKAEERRQRRLAGFSKTGGPAMGRTGFAGLGTAR